MPKIFKNFSRIVAQPYQFPDAKELRKEEELQSKVETVSEPETDEEAVMEEVAPEEESSPEEEPIRFAQIQADMIIQDAYRQAEEIIAKARLEAEQECESIRETAREIGQTTGYAQGVAKARMDAKAELEEQAVAQAAAVQEFLDRAGVVFDRQMDDCVGDLRDLALAVAEKVVSISLRSSSEVICRMIQNAVDKRKRREWAHIYIAECDAKRMVQIPASLSASLSALSDRVRIIPMADDEEGTCIIEMPDEIIDASASTQLGNIRRILNDAPSSGTIQQFNPFE